MGNDYVLEIVEVHIVKIKLYGDTIHIVQEI